MLRRCLTISLAVVLISALAVSAAEPKKVLLLAGKSSHGHGAHEHLPGMQLLAKCLKDVPGLDVKVHYVGGDWAEGPNLIKQADGIVMYMDYGMRWEQSDPARQAALQDLMKRGGGVVALHWSLGGRDAKDIPFHLKLVGGCHGGPDRKYAHAETDLKVASPDHPISAGVDNFRLNDEYYYQLKWAKAGTITPILVGTVRDCPDQTIAWAFERPDGGRSVGFAAMHTHANWGVVPCRRLIAQGVLWSVKLPVPKEGLPVVITEEDLELPKKS
jgi:type 1 glutamine amidotransferase